MKTKYIILIIAIILLLVLGFFFYKNSYTCGTLFNIRDTKTGQCTFYVGCSLPVGVTEDIECRDTIRQQVDRHNSGFNSSDYCEATIDTCLPADKCEFQTDNEGRKVCLGKY